MVDLPEPAGPSMAITRMSAGTLPAAELAEITEVVGIGLGHAVGVGDLDAFDDEAEEGEAHGHPVVVIRLDPTRLGTSGIHGKAGFFLGGRDADPAELGDGGGDAVGLVAPDEVDAGDAGWSVGEDGDDGEG